MLFTTGNLPMRCVLLAAVVWLWTGWGASLYGDDGGRFTLNLLRPYSMDGWDHGSEGTRGWSIAHGLLLGEVGAARLLSGYSVDEFELRVVVRSRGKGAGGVAVVLVPMDAAHTERRIVLPGEADWKTYTLVRQGANLTVQTGEQQQPQAALPADARYVLALEVDGTQANVGGLHLTERPGEAIFNGRDLAGWWTPGNLDSWIVEEGNIVCINRQGNYLRSEREYGNFTLSLEYQIASGGNSGIGIRTPRDGWPSSDGMELQILDEKPGTPITRHSTMAIYGNLEPLARADKPQSYNRVVIKAEGPMVSAWVNGELIQQTNTARLPELWHRNLSGWIGFQDHGARVEFRNIRVREAAAGRGLAEWWQPQRQGASHLLLNRLMNPSELLAEAPLATKVVTGRAAESGAGSEQTLAQLQGPGAVVNIARSNSSGEVALYFDGESQPRVRCAASELHKHLPPVGENPHPILTYVPFAESLRIAIRDHRPVEYTFETVLLTDASVPLESFAGPDSSTQRGLLPAISYRLLMFSHGKLRSHDPAPRQSAEPATLEPGSTVPLVSIAGRGMIEWWRLKAPLAALEGDDLWLEVRVDDEPEPSIAAPVRMLFPHRGMEGRYRNLVVASQGTELACNLPIPYGRGVQIAAVNRGSKPIKQVGMEISYLPAEQYPWAGTAARLHGQYLAAGNGAARQLLSLAGRGRLVGLVYEPIDDRLPKFERVSIDGQPRDDALAGSLQRLCGVPNSANARYPLSGWAGGLAWRWLLNAPVDFQQSLDVEADAAPLGNRLLWFVTLP